MTKIIPDETKSVDFGNYVSCIDYNYIDSNTSRGHLEDLQCNVKEKSSTPVSFHHVLVDNFNPNKDLVILTFFILRAAMPCNHDQMPEIVPLLPGRHSSVHMFPQSCHQSEPPQSCHQSEPPQSSHQSEPPQLLVRLVWGRIFSKKLVDRFGGPVLNYETSSQENVCHGIVFLNSVESWRYHHYKKKILKVLSRIYISRARAKPGAALLTD